MLSVEIDANLERTGFEVTASVRDTEIGAGVFKIVRGMEEHGLPVMRSRFEVNPIAQGTGIGRELVKKAFEILPNYAPIVHQEAFSDSGEERLKKYYIAAGYKETYPDVYEKIYR